MSGSGSRVTPSAPDEERKAGSAGAGAGTSSSPKQEQPK
jgi:hypothetical protein